MLTNEAIEVHLGYLRPAVEMLGNKVDAFGDKLEQVDKEHLKRVAKLQASLDGLKWFISSATLLVSGVSIAHSLGWI